MRTGDCAADGTEVFFVLEFIMRFSQRIGVTPKEIPIQVGSISTDLRNSLWNVVYAFYVQYEEEVRDWKNTNLGAIADLGHRHFFKLPIDTLPEYRYRYCEWLKDRFFKIKWHELYDFIEWLASYGAHWTSWSPGNVRFERSIKFVEQVNRTLEIENSGYRFVGKLITPITNETELSEIESALQSDVNAGSVSQHIESALALLSNKTSPDYRNSIKEAISAVEAAAQWATGDKNATLGQAIKLLEKSKPLHPALKEGLSKLYGWTSDSNGIRHALQETSNLELADARFFLVICSAFSNYLVDRTKSQES
ncbi:MAG: AbiJ-NTD4 domain-containing protein [Rhizobiaceae bacterium]